MPIIHRTNNGFILIFALWVLGFLALLAVSLAGGVRQKVLLVRKLEERGRAAAMADAVLKTVRVYLRQEMASQSFQYSPSLKANLHNNPAAFGSLVLGDDEASVGYDSYEQRFHVYGLVDEERKVNINHTNPVILSRLIERVLFKSTQESKLLAEYILDWRQLGERQVSGFFSDEYYSNLQYPFKKKDADFETLDELLLVKGMDQDMFDRLRPFVTIYGDGKVNINTAPAAVLYALGLEDDLIDKILLVRKGKDDVEATADDHFFVRTFDVASEVAAFIKLDLHEIQAIDALNLQNVLTINSMYFSAAAELRLAHSRWRKSIQAVFSAKEDRVVYYREK